MEKERIAIDSTQDPNPGKGSRSPSDEEMESEVEEVMESEVDLYFRVKQRDRKYEWFVIRGDDMSGGNKKELEPAFSSPQPAHLTLFSCSGVVGSTIYVIGGLNPDISHPCVMGKRLGHPLYDEVYCIDTESPEGGWKKEKSMIKPRGYAYTVTVDSKMYVFGNVIKGHNSGSGKEFLMAEVFDATKRTWKALSRLVPPSLKFYQVFGHAVSEDNKTILLHGYDDPNLYKYDIESDSWDIYSKSCVGPEGMRSSALVDGVLYYVDHATLGVMFALDLVNHENKLHEVTGLDEVLLPPHLVKYAPGIRLRELLFSLGNSMLAMVWATSVNEFDSERIAICCSKLKMSRQQDDHTGQVTFRAQYLSRSCHPVKGFSIYDGVSVKRQRKAPTASIFEAEAVWV